MLPKSKYELIKDQIVRERNELLADWRADFNQFKKDNDINSKEGKRVYNRKVYTVVRKSSRILAMIGKGAKDFKIQKQKKRKKSNKYRKIKLQLKFIPDDSVPPDSYMSDLVLRNKATESMKSLGNPGKKSVECSNVDHDLRKECYEGSSDVQSILQESSENLNNEECLMRVICSTPNKDIASRPSSLSMVDEEETRNLSTAVHIYATEKMGSLSWLTRNVLDIAHFEAILQYTGKLISHENCST